MFLLSATAVLQAFIAQASSLAAICHLVEHILAASAAMYIVLSGVRFCKDQYTWWPRYRSYGPNDEQPFRYEALQHNFIRLLILEAGSAEDSIRGQLFHAPLLASSRHHEALSYTWGSARSQYVVEINGNPFRVNQSLFKALQHFRREDVTRVLWIDAICINQEDSKETSEQVMLMSEIYRNAGTVQIWLGPENEFTAAGMRVLSFLAGGEDTALETPLIPWKDSGFSDREVEGLKDILDRLWFERVWVVQEAALSNRATLSIGHQSLSWDEFSSLRFLKRIKFAEIGPQWRHTVEVDMKSLRELLEFGLRVTHGFTEAPDLLDVVHEMRHRKATDSRDEIYSACGLAKGGNEFQVDYSLSAETFENLYHSVRLKYKDRWASNVKISATNQSRLAIPPFDY